MADHAEHSLSAGAKAISPGKTGKVVGIAGPGGSLSNKVVGIALDESETHHKVLHWALEHAIGASDRVVLIHADKSIDKVVPPNVLMLNSEFAEKIKAQTMAKHSREVHDRLQRAAELIRGKTHCKEVDTVIEVGDPRDVVAATVEEQNVSVLIVGARGMSGLKRLLMGSVSDYLTKHLDIPVIIVR